MATTSESALDATVRIIADAGSKHYVEKFRRKNDRNYVVNWARGRTRTHLNNIVAELKKRGFSDGLVQVALAPIAAMAFILTEEEMEVGAHDPRHATSLTG